MLRYMHCGLQTIIDDDALHREQLINSKDDDDDDDNDDNYNFVDYDDCGDDVVKAAVE